jgi:hypothetical protein
VEQEYKEEKKVEDAMADAAEEEEDMPPAAPAPMED